MTFAHVHLRPRTAVFAALALTLLVGVLALRSHPADAATPIIQNSSGQTATFEQFGFSTDGCTDTYATMSVGSSRSVATTSGGPATTTNQTVLNGYAGVYNYCTGQYREGYWNNVPLTPNQFRIDSALNQAVLSGTIPASYGDGCDANGNCDWNAGSGTFSITWQRTGTQLVTPTHSTSHTSGSVIVNVNLTGQAYQAQANGSIVLTGLGGGPVPVTSTNSDYSYQDDTYLSSNMSVNVVVLRPQTITLPAGDTLTFHNATMSACDPLTWGYQLDGGANVTVGSKSGAWWDCGPDSTPDTTIGPFSQSTSVRVWLTDESASYCSGFPASYTYYSDGLHALVTGTSPYQVDIMDSGGGCGVPADQLRLPGGPGQGNLSVQLVISAP